MRKFIFITGLFLLTCFVVEAQQIQEKDYISVEGSYTHKEMPDSIVLSVTLKDNSQASKSDISRQEKDMLGVLQKLGINVKKALKVDDYTTFNQKRNNMTSIKSFKLYLDDYTQVNNVFRGLNNIGIMDVNVFYTGLTNYKTILLDVKVKALQDAQKQAKTLVESIGYKLGKPILIEDTRFSLNSMPLYARSAYNNDAMSGEEASEIQQLEFKETEVKATINVRFLIE